MRENFTRKEHEYHPGDLVLIKRDQPTKFGKNPYKGPFTVITTEGANVTIAEGNVTDVYNVRQLKPYHSRQV